ncbi:hypothetical protein Q7P37_010479 [Cladosporium fusiforme]
MFYRPDAESETAIAPEAPQLDAYHLSEPFSNPTESSSNHTKGLKKSRHTVTGWVWNDAQPPTQRDVANTHHDHSQPKSVPVTHQNSIGNPFSSLGHVASGHPPKNHDKLANRKESGEVERVDHEVKMPNEILLLICEHFASKESEVTIIPKALAEQNQDESPLAYCSNRPSSHGDLFGFRKLRTAYQDTLKLRTLNGHINHITFYILNFDFSPIMDLFFADIEPAKRALMRRTKFLVKLTLTMDGFQNKLTSSAKAKQGLQTWASFLVGERAAYRSVRVEGYKCIKMGDTKSQLAGIYDAIRLINENFDADHETERVLKACYAFGDSHWSGSSDDSDLIISSTKAEANRSWFHNSNFRIPALWLYQEAGTACRGLTASQGNSLRSLPHLHDRPQLSLQILTMSHMIKTIPVSSINVPSRRLIHPLSLWRPGQRGTASFTKKQAILPRTFPTDGFSLLPKEERFDEESLVGYKAEEYYPLRLGEVFNSKYQVVAKLGFGTTSTVWLCRNLQLMCTTGEESSREVTISDHFKSIECDRHPGRTYLRVALEKFHVQGPHGRHLCLVFPPLGRTLGELRDVFPDRALDKTLLQKFLYVIVTALDFMHQVGVVHTDLSPNNILVGADESAVSKVEEAEIANPSARKVLADSIIHLSYTMPTTYDPPSITDFGAARLGQPGQKYSGDVMPGVFRAPEVIAGMEWDDKIDIWSVGVMIWNLLEGRNLFRPVRKGHFAVQGHWIASTPIPDQTLESREVRLQGKDRELILTLMRKILTWLPEDRPSTQDLLEDEFICQFASEESTSAS